MDQRNKNSLLVVTLKCRFGIRFLEISESMKSSIGALFEAEGFLAFADLNFSSTGTWGTVYVFWS